MSHYTPRQSAKFESRQMAFDFGMACRFVAELGASIRKTLNKWACAYFAPVKPAFFPPVQKILDLSLEVFPPWPKTFAASQD